MATDIGGLGVWSFIDNLDAAGAAGFARQLEAWGYGALWIPEAVGRDPFPIIAWMAAHTSKLVFCTGIANIYARDPMTMNAIRKTLGELAPGRIVLGLGVSHSHLVQNVRGHEYSNKPVATMRAYLEGMEKALYMGPAPAEEPPVVLAALRTNMLKLSAEKVAGAHPYFVPPRTRQRLAPRWARRPGCAPSRWCSPSRIRRRRAPLRASTWRSTSACRTTRTTCSNSASPWTTSPTAAATAWSMPSWPGAMTP